ncbi:PAS domain S-box protein [Schinkia azotoformans]|uniref:PAS domain S-box protein n=1 Tax=Schinkia azotoformans TaxID=1454 RepID=UPI002DB68531|nr:PAS domain S-box protein [Schinkia azotoformans]
MINVNLLNNKLLDIIFESTYYGTVIVDRDGKIQYMSNNYCEFLGVERETVIGEHVTDVIENTRMHLIVQAGKSETADLQFLRGNLLVANRMPIIENNEIIGAIGIIVFRDLADWKSMNSHINEHLTNPIFKEEWKSTEGVKYSINNLIGNSRKIEELKTRIKRVAMGDISF